MLGPLEVLRDDAPVALPPGHPRALLGMLLIHANSVVSKDRLITELWPEDPPRSAGHALQVYVSRLRRQLEPGLGSARDERVLLTRRPGYLLVVPVDGCDAGRFERMLADARRALDQGHPAEASRLCQEAREMWRGPVLADLHEEAFVAGEAARLDELYLVASEVRVEAELALGHHAALIGEVEALVRRHPFRERLWAYLIVALYRSSRQVDALNAYRRLRAMLGEEVGLDPSPELSELERAVLRHDPALGIPPGAEESERPLAAPPPATPRGVPLPSRLEALPATGFVGRQTELRRFAGLFENVAAGAGPRVVLIQGEPGVGKTTLVAEFARVAHPGGAIVLYGRCEEGLAIPYQPFVEALGQYVRHGADDVLAAHVAEHGGELAGLVPELTRRLRELPPSRTDDADTQRYQLFNAVVALLASASAASPVVLALDDLHWADASTLLLLRYLVGAEVTMRLLLLGTFRGSELGDSSVLRDALAALHKEKVERLDLGGLEENDVVTLVESRAVDGPHDDAVELARHLRRETGGNPFFVLEILRHRVEEGSPPRLAPGGLAASRSDRLVMPQSLQEVVTQRAARLGEPARRLLRLAAVVGRDFDVELLCEVTGAVEDEVVEALDRASAAALLAEVGPGRYSFAHAVIQYTLYDSLSSSRRQVVHLRVAKALERLHGAGPGPRVAELARHWLAGAPPAGAETAVRYAQWAGEAALRGLAFEEAVSWYSQALDLLARESAPSGHLRVELLIGLGSAQRCAGDPGHRETLLTAGREAIIRGDGRAAARAALTNERGIFSRVGEVDVERVTALEDALAAIGPAPTPLRARLLALLATEVHFTRNSPSLGLVRQALAIARNAADPAALAPVLSAAWFAHWNPTMVVEQSRLADELADLAASQGDRGLAFQGGFARYISGNLKGDMVQADAGLASCIAVASELNQPVLTWRATNLRFHRALVGGRLDEAERLNDESGRRTVALGQPDVETWYHGPRAVLRMFQGRTDEAATLIDAAIKRFPDVPGYQALGAWIHARAGREGEAWATLRRLRVEGAGIVPRDDDKAREYYWLVAAAVLSGACVQLGDAETAGKLYALLLPHRGLMAMGMTIWLGPVAHHLGLLATLLERYDEADRLFADAAAAQEQMDARAGLVHTHLEWARMLRLRARPEDGARARSLLDSALAGARKAGLVDVIPRIHAVAP